MSNYFEYIKNTVGLFFRILTRRIKFALNIRDVVKSVFEDYGMVCSQCGNRVYITGEMESDKFCEVVINDDFRREPICLDCFLKLAIDNNIHLDIEDFKSFKLSLAYDWMKFNG